jgi:uncharacterized protein YlxW (UPF0749 family)
MTMAYAWSALQSAVGSQSNVIILLIVSICTGGGLVQAIQWLANRGKSNAEEAEIWTKASVTRLQTMHEEMTKLDTRMRALNEELDVERRLRIETTRKLESAVAALARAGVHWEG